MRDQRGEGNRERRPAVAAVSRIANGALPALPAPLTRLIGRDADIGSLVEAVTQDGARLLTVTGAGGTGKTRVALAVAAIASDVFPDGVVFVDLAPLTSATMVLPAIAAALGVRESASQSVESALSRSLATKRLLLVLDNCEHVVAAAPDIATLLTDHPVLTILATSREPLGVRGEREFPLLPLGVPDFDAAPGFPELVRAAAVALFVERAAEGSPGFALTDANAADVAAICRRLDGLPLAIELAAARMRVLTPAALLARLDPRLPLLTGGSRDLPARQRTMRDAIAWSYDLLPKEEQILFRRLSVFAGGFTLGGAEAMAPRSWGERGRARDGQPTVLDLVTALTVKNLVRRTPTVDGEPRFEMLETIREYGGEQLAACRELERARGRHAMHFLALAEKAEPLLRGSDQGVWLNRLESEHDNLRAALTWCLTRPGRAGDAVRLAGALHWFWYLRGHYREGRHWLEEAVGAAIEPSLARAKALAGSGVLAFPHGDFTGGRDRLRESIAIGRALGDPGTVAYGLHFLAIGDLPHVDPETSREQLAESVALFREAGDRWGLAMALRGLGMVALVSRRFDEADGPFAESLTLTRDLGDVWCLARVLHYSGEVARAQGDLEGARQRYDESLSLYRELDLRNPAAIVLHNLGYIVAGEGEPRRASHYFAEALATHDENLNLLNVGHCLVGLAVVAEQIDRPEQAARLLGAADAMLERIGAAIWPVDKVEHDRTLAAVVDRLGAVAFSAAFAAGRALSPEEAVAEAFAIKDEAEAVSDRVSWQDSAPGADVTYRLTAREQEILLLLSERRTDREIAHALSISPRTVMHHVSSILAKLGVSNRREAAALAANLDLSCLPTDAHSQRRST
jgi:predicted ATPase/DNA-binding CsgD family transcriptional regulator